MALGNGIKAVGFDMDGTVMDTIVDLDRLSRVVEDEFISLGVPSEVIELDRKVHSMDNGIGWLIANGKADVLPTMGERIEARATKIEMENADKAKVFPGAVEVIDTLRTKGYKVGILTRGGRGYVMKILGDAGITGLFDTIICRDDYPQKEAKPAPESIGHLAEKLDVAPSEILYVGDGGVDYKTAASSGSQFIGVDSGELSHQEWIDMFGPSVFSVPSIADLKDII